MTKDPCDDLVARQYRTWQYPLPIEDLETWLVAHWEWFDPSHAHHVFWPDRPYQPQMDILVAGCGTNQAAVIAYTNREARVTAIDISKESLDHGRYLKHKHGLTNLELHLLPIEEVASLGTSFDLIIASGVLHHMASPETGTRALAGVLRPDGVAAIMLYARYGRLGVEMMQSVFRDLGLRQNDESLRLVCAALDWLDPSHPVQTYRADAPDLGYDAGMVDTFLHGRDVSFTVAGCLDLVEGAGLVFQDWFFKSPYHPPTLVEPNNPFLAAVSELPRRQMWAAMEPLRNRNGCHLFLACRPDRPPLRYRIDFGEPAALDMVPVWRLHARVEGTAVVGYGWDVPLSDTQLGMVELIDGQRRIGEIAADSPGIAAGVEPGAAAYAVVRLVEQLWRLDFLAVRLDPVSR